MSSTRSRIVVSPAGWMFLAFVAGCLVLGYRDWSKGPGPLKWIYQEPENEKASGIMPEASPPDLQRTEDD